MADDDTLKLRDDLRQWAMKYTGQTLNWWGKPIDDMTKEQLEFALKKIKTPWES